VIAKVLLKQPVDEPLSRYMIESQRLRESRGHPTPIEISQDSRDRNQIITVEVAMTVLWKKRLGREWGMAAMQLGYEEEEMI
jgi:hypothetical protein